MTKATLLSVFVLTFLFALVESHSYLSSITIDGLAYNEGDCGRPQPKSKYDYPIAELGRQNGLSSNDMTCGWLPEAARPANKKCPVNPGSTITLQWHYEKGMGDRDTFYIDPSHQGPCIVYMAKSETGSGKVWFKVFEDGWDPSSKKFCVTRLRENKGRMTFRLPTDITPGNYLLRGELIALHEGHKLYGAQPYVGCFEVTMTGNGQVNPGNLVAIPGVYTPQDAGIFFSPYKTFSSYPVPGPTVYKSGTTPTPPPSTPATTGRSQPVTTQAARQVSTTRRTQNQGSSSSSSGTSTTGVEYIPGEPNTPDPTETPDEDYIKEPISSSVTIFENIRSVSFLVIVILIGLVFNF